MSTFQHRIKELVTEEEDKKKELIHVKKALSRCGHPNWSLNRKQKKNKNTEKVERRGKVIIPYVKGISEKLSRVFKKYDLETIHKPTMKLKNILCNKMKDKVENLDKTGAVYYTNCKKHKTEDEKNDYVGETDRVTRERLYEHKVIDHKTAKRAASITHPGETNKEPERRNCSRSTRKKTDHDYYAIHHNKDQQLTEGNTEFSAHVASDTHNIKEDLEYSILCTEENWFKRGVKEAIAIKKIRPTLNKDDGRYHLPAIYDNYIKSSVTMKIPGQGTEGATDQH